MTRETEVARVLAEVLDPELGIGIVDLGLIYGIHRDDRSVRVEMTTTTEFCPMGGVLFEAANAALTEAFSPAHVEVTLVDEPRWEPAMLSPRARATLGLPPV
jgi:metal-sulfur cluster biosynthetic enzyme